MFEQLVVSSLQRRKQTTAKYFFGTGALYVLAIACAFVASVLMSEPRLADTDNILTLVGPSLPPARGEQPRDRGPQRPTQPASQPDPTRVRNFDEISRGARTSPPTITAINTAGDGSDPGPGSDLPGSGPGSPGGVPDGVPTVAPAPRPDPPRPQPAAQPAPAIDNRPVRVPSSILQGKAIERRKPVYPPIAKQIRLQGDVSIEVMIAPDGHVESARVVSGHPVLADKAREAALGWRFQPTLLNQTPVRVTGVIVFVFKLSE